MFEMYCDVSLFFEGDGDHRDLHVLTHSFPTRRSSDLDLANSAIDDRQADGAPRPADARPHAIPLQIVIGLGIMLIALPAMLGWRSEEHTSELQSLMRISYAVLCF